MSAASTTLYDTGRDELVTASRLERELRLRSGTIREGAAQGMWGAHYAPNHKKPRYSVREVREGLGMHDG